MDIFQKLMEIEEETGSDVSTLKKLIQGGQLTTASNINRPTPRQDVIEIDAINEFMKRNPRADGGMLVQPSADGSRPGYKTAKRIEPNIGKTDLGKYEVKYKNKQIGTFDKISDAREALSIAKENDPPIPRKDVQLKGKVSFRSIVEQVMDDLLEEGYDAFSTADINSKLPKKIKNQYGVTNKTILKAIKTNRKLDKFKDFKFSKGTGLNQVKPLTKNKQKILIESFPEIDFDFTTGRKYGIDKTSDPVRWKKIKDFIEMPSEGLFPYGVEPKDGLWNSLYRSTVSGDRWQLISKVPKNWRKGGAWKKSKFKDTLTNKIITYDNLEKYVDSQGGKGTYKNSLKSWENRKALTDIKIIFKGKEQSLGGVLNQQAIAKFGKEIPSGAKNVPFFGAFQIAHKQGVGNNFWDVEVAYRDANLKLNSLNKQLLSELKTVDNLNQRKKIIKNYSKQIKALPGGASFMFEGQELGKAPTLKSATEAAFKDLGLSRTFNVNQKQILQNIQANSKLKECKIPAADGGRIGFALSDKCIRDGLNETKKKAAAGDKKAARQLVETAEAATKGRLLKNILGPGAILGELVFEGALIGNKILGGTPKDIAWAESYLSYLDPRKYSGQLDPLKMRREDMTTREIEDADGNIKTIDGPYANILRSGFAAQDQLSAFNEALQDREIAKNRGRTDQYNVAAADAREQGRFADQSADIISSEAFKDASNMAQEYIQGQEGQRMFPYNQFKQSIGRFESGEDRDYRRRKEQEMKNLYTQYSDDEIRQYLKQSLGTDDDKLIDQYLELTGVTERITPAVTRTLSGLDVLRTGAQEQETMQNLMGGAANFAGGGIAKLAGVSSGPPPESGPNSQGLQGLFNRVKKG